VVAGHRATTFVVSAQGGSGPGLYVVAADAPGLKREEQRGTHGRALSRLEFVDVPAHRLELDLEWLILRVHALQCAEALGVARAAVEMTAKFTATRQQFGAPIATFQAVRQRAADAYVATQVMEVTTRRAVYLVGCDGEASGAVDVARYWASEGGHQVSTAAMHLHGGMGFDRDYPLHRLFLAHKQLETRLGSAEGQLAAIGHTIRQQVSASI
jgi:alkylation response protein AidB-like acyl-CoA dehydrogenase